MYQFIQSMWQFIQGYFNLFVQTYAMNPDWIVYTAYFIAVVIVIVYISFNYEQFHDSPKLNWLSFFHTTEMDRWNTWVAPLISVGGILGILLAAHTNPLLADLSLLFGSLILLASLLNAAIPQDLRNAPQNSPLMSIMNIITYVVSGLSTFLLIGAVLGELLAAFVLVQNTNLSSPLVTTLFRVVIIIATLLTIIYFFGPPIQKVFQRLPGRQKGQNGQAPQQNTESGA